MMKNIIYLIIYVLLLSCTKKNETNNPATESERILIEDYKRLDKLKSESIHDGNENAYAWLIDYYNNNHSDYYELLPISILMAEKHNSERSYITIYKYMIMINNDGKGDDELFRNLKDVDRKFALYYLEEGAKKSNVGCIGTLEKIYRNGIGVNKNIKKADSLNKLSKELVFKKK